MHNRPFVALLLLCLILSLALVYPTVATAQRSPAARQRAPLLFVENVGQFDDAVRFQLRGGTASLWFAEDSIWLTVVRAEGTAALPGESEGTANLRFGFAGASAAMHLEPYGPLPTTVTYIRGSDGGGRLRPRAYSGLRYRDVYPGVDLEIGSEAGVLFWRWLSRGGADPSIAALSVEGADGAVLTEAGALRLSTSIGGIDVPMPTLEGAVATAAVQAVGPGALSVQHAYVRPAPGMVVMSAMTGLSYLTYLGGSGREDDGGLTVDADGAAYAAGSTYSADFPTTPGVVKGTVEYSDAFVTKLSADGSAVIFSTLLGGTDRDGAADVFLGDDASIYVIGETHSADFPTTADAYDRTFGGGTCYSHGAPYEFPCTDTFVARLSADGTSLLFSTFLGGSEAEWGRSLVLEAGGSMLVSGSTRSTDFPTTAGAFDRTHAGHQECSFGAVQMCADVFVARLTAGASSLAAATLLGGTGDDGPTGMVTDSAGSVILTGSTHSPDFPVTADGVDVVHSADLCHLGPGSETEVCGDAYVARLSADLSALTYGTFLGGVGNDYGAGLALDASGRVFVAGAAGSADFPTTSGAHDRTYADGVGFLARLSDDRSNLVFSTFVAGGAAVGLALDPLGEPAVFDAGLGLTRWSSDGALLGAFSLTLPDDLTSPADFALGPGGQAYFTGLTYSDALGTTPGSYDPTYNGVRDTFVGKMAVDVPPVAADDDLTLVAGETATLAVLANDVDADGDALTVAAVTQGASGTVAIAAGGTTVTYTATAGFSGSDSFTYTVADGSGGVDTATVAVTVTAPEPTPLPTDEPTSVPAPTGPPTAAPTAPASQFLPIVR